MVSGGCLYGQRFELWDGHLYRVQIGRVRRQAQTPCAPTLQHVRGVLAFVAGQVV